MKNLTLIIAMSMGLFVLGTFANSDWWDSSNLPKVMYRRGGKLPSWLGKFSYFDRALVTNYLKQPNI